MAEVTERSTVAWIHDIGPNFFQTFDLGLLRGREFTSDDDEGSPPVVVVNKTFLLTLGVQGEVLGETVVIDGSPFEIVGVVDDVAYRNATQGPTAQVYRAYWQDATNADARIFVSTETPASVQLAGFRSEVHAVDANVPVAEVRTMKRLLDDLLPGVHLVSRVLGISGALALLLSALGLYGVLAQAVARRTRDIGIRKVLGGTDGHITMLVFRDTFALVTVGVVLGALASSAAHRSLSGYLYGVEPSDPLTLGIAGLILVTVASLAAWIPTCRATSVDPLVALKSE